MRHAERWQPRPTPPPSCLRTSRAAHAPVPLAPCWSCPLIFGPSFALCPIWGHLGECPVLGGQADPAQALESSGVLESCFPHSSGGHTLVALLGDAGCVSPGPHCSRVSSVTALVLVWSLFLRFPAQGSALVCGEAQEQARTQVTITRGVRGQWAPSRALGGCMWLGWGESGVETQGPEEKQGGERLENAVELSDKEQGRWRVTDGAWGWGNPRRMGQGHGRRGEGPLG